MMQLGVCYYPEQWPVERWAVDARQMRDLGLQLVRIGEFAWAAMQPAPDRTDWAWLDRAVETLATADLRVILGTPTATPPVWLTRQHPEIRRVDADGRVRDHGTRRHYCPNNPTYRAWSRRIVEAMAQRYGTHPAVVGWQIDNEFGGGHSARCYCPACQTAFQEWLRARYGNIAALNDAWGNVFWSQTYGDFGQITPPHAGVNYKNPSHALDFYRFSSESHVAYQREQIAILRRVSPGRWITHNFMGLYRDLDQFALSADLDFASWDSYPTGNPDRWRRFLYAPGRDTRRNDPVYAYDVGDPLIQGFAHALTYGLKRRPFWVMEQQAGQINWADLNPGVRPGTPRLWVWHAVAEGAEAVLFFRWRASTLAHEQYHSGLLRHDTSPDVGYGDAQRLAAEQAQLAALAAAPCDAPVALLCSFDDLWSLELQPHRRDFDYLRHLFVFYRALSRLGIAVHVTTADADLSPYRLAIAPSLHLVNEATAARLQAYVEQGGALLLGVRSGFKTPDNRVTDRPLPGALATLVGAHVVDWQTLPDDVTRPLRPSSADAPTAAGYWVERLRCLDAQPLLQYADDDATAALTERRSGAGRALYLGWYPTDDDALWLLRRLSDELGLARLDGLPAGVVGRRRGDRIVLLNFTDVAQAVPVGGQTVHLPPRDVAVVAA